MAVMRGCCGLTFPVGSTDVYVCKGPVRSSTSLLQDPATAAVLLRTCSHFQHFGLLSASCTGLLLPSPLALNCDAWGATSLYWNVHCAAGTMLVLLYCTVTVTWQGAHSRWPTYMPAAPCVFNMPAAGVAGGWNVAGWLHRGFHPAVQSPCVARLAVASTRRELRAQREENARSKCPHNATGCVNWLCVASNAKSVLNSVQTQNTNTPRSQD